MFDFNMSLIGNLGGDPEVKVFSDGSKVTNFSVAHNIKYKDRDGINHERTVWVRCAAWGKVGEILAEYARKGSQVALSGEPSAQAYLNNEGEATGALCLKVLNFKFLGSNDRDKQTASRGQQSKPQPATVQDQPAPEQTEEAEGIDDDLPF